MADKLRELIESGTDRVIWKKSRLVPSSSIPWIGDDTIYINGRSVDTSILDSLAYHAGYFNGHPFNVDRGDSQPRQLSKEEWLGLPFNESSFGAAPIYNYTDKDVIDGMEFNRKDYNRALGNSNYVQTYGSIPQFALMRDWRYLDSDTNHDLPAIQHAYSYYQQGKYNPRMGSHSNHIVRDGRYLWSLRPIQEWWNKSGKQWYDYGREQQFKDDDRNRYIRKREERKVSVPETTWNKPQKSSQSTYYIERNKKYNMSQFNINQSK